MTRIIICLFLSFFAPVVLGVPGSWAEQVEIPVIPLTPGESAPGLLPYARYTMSAGNGETVAETLADSAPLASVPYQKFYFGPAKGPILLLFQLQNVGDATGTWVFNSHRRSLRSFRLIKISAGLEQQLLDIRDLGQMRESLHRFHNLAYEFSLEEGERCYFAVIFEAEISTRAHFEIESTRENEQDVRTRGAQTLFFATGTATLVLINSCLFLLIRRRVFLYFVIAELAFLYQAVLLQGYTFIYLWHEFGSFNAESRVIADCLMSIYSLKFARDFLHTSKRWPTIDRMIGMLVGVGWLLLLLQLSQMFLGILPARYIALFSMAMTGISSLLLPFVALLSVRQYGLIYLPLVVSWGVLGLYIGYCALVGTNVIAGFFDFDFWLVPLSFFEAFCMTLALALDIRSIQNRELTAQEGISAALSEQLRLSQQANRANQLKNLALQELVDKGRLILAAGHDSKSFLSSISYFGQALSSASSLSESRQLGEKISTASDLLSNTLSVVTENSSGGVAGDEIVTLETINAEQLLDGVRMMHDDMAREKGIIISCRSSIDTFAGDRFILTRILSNLAGNAVKYANGGRILLAARRSGQSVRLQVWDQGAGIEASMLERLLASNRDRIRLNEHIAGEGAGLGVCCDLAANINAVLKASSTVGRGSVFELLVPLRSNALQPPLQCGVFESVEGGSDSLVEALNSSGMTVNRWPVEQVPEQLPSLDVAIVNHMDMEVLADCDIGRESKPVRIVASYDKSGGFRSRSRGIADIIVYKPLDKAVLDAVMELVLSKNKNREESDESSSESPVCTGS